MYRVLVLVISITAGNFYSVFDVDGPLSSENVDVRVMRRSKRNAKSGEMPLFYDVRLHLNGKDVTTRLYRHEDTLSLIPTNADWAGYTSKDTRGIFIVRRDTTANIVLEGYISHSGTRFYIQPNGTAGGHVIHTMYTSPTEFTGNNGYESSRIRESRKKRTRDMLTWPMLYLKVSFFFDPDAVKLYETQVIKWNLKFSAEALAYQIAIFSALYVEESFGNLRDTVPLTLKVLPISWRGRTNQQVLRLTKGQSRDGRRETVCGQDMFPKVQQHRRASPRYTDMTFYFTGFDILDKNGVQELQSLVEEYTICTPRACALIEATRSLSIVRRIAQNIMLCIGVDYDGGPDPRTINCPASDNYIMSPNSVAPSSERNADLYSDCTKRWLRRTIELLNHTTIVNCLAPPPPNARMEQFNPKQSMETYNEQCLVETNTVAAINQNEYTICEQGILCENGELIIPMTGTRCKAPGVPGAPYTSRQRKKRERNKK